MTAQREKFNRAFAEREALLAFPGAPFAVDHQLDRLAGAADDMVVSAEFVVRPLAEIAEEQREASSHAVYLDHTLVGRLGADRAEFTALPEVGAGPHRVAIHVSPFPGIGFCDDFVLRKVTFSCE